MKLRASSRRRGRGRSLLNVNGMGDLVSSGAAAPHGFDDGLVAMPDGVLVKPLHSFAMKARHRAVPGRPVSSHEAHSAQWLLEQASRDGETVTSGAHPAQLFRKFESTGST
jgi:hypothetical protein